MDPSLSYLWQQIVTGIMRRSCHLERFGLAKGSKNSAGDPEKVSAWSPGRSDPCKADCTTPHAPRQSVRKELNLTIIAVKKNPTDTFNGYVRDARVLAARLDYAVAANLNLFTSLFWAERTANGYGWGVISPNDTFMPPQFVATPNDGNVQIGINGAAGSPNIPELTAGIDNRLLSRCSRADCLEWRAFPFPIVPDDGAQGLRGVPSPQGLDRMQRCELLSGPRYWVPDLPLILAASWSSAGPGVVKGRRLFSVSRETSHIASGKENMPAIRKR